MDFLTRQQFLDTVDLPFRDVDLPDPYQGKVRITGLSAEEASEFANKADGSVTDGVVQANKIPHDIMAELLSRVITNDKFERLFTPADVAAINKKSAKTVLFLAEIALELSGLSDDAKKKATKN